MLPGERGGKIAGAQNAQGGRGIGGRRWTNEKWETAVGRTGATVTLVARAADFDKVANGDRSNT